MPSLDLFFNRKPGRSATERRQDYLDLRTVTRHAEQVGIGGVFVTEHPAAVGGSTPSALTEVVALGASTERIQVGTAGVIGPLRHPRALAEETAQADTILGPGRLIAGIVKGFQPAVFADRDLPVATADDYVAFLTKFKEELKAAGCDVPVWATGSAAAITGGGLMTNPYARKSRATLASDIAAYQTKADRDMDVFAHLLAFIDPCPERAREVGCRAIDAYLAHHGAGEKACDLIDAGLVAVGTPGAVAGVLAWFKSVGVTRLGINPLLGFLPTSEVLRTVDLLAEQVARQLDAELPFGGRPGVPGPSFIPASQGGKDR